MLQVSVRDWRAGRSCEDPLHKVLDFSRDVRPIKKETVCIVLIAKVIGQAKRPFELDRIRMDRPPAC